jgi:hypothetical protein
MQLMHSINSLRMIDVLLIYLQDAEMAARGSMMADRSDLTSS